MKIALLGSAEPRKNVHDTCLGLGLRDCTEFSYANEIIPILKVSTCHLLITAGSIEDMHWSTFFRTLRTDPAIPFLPAIFVPDVADPQLRKNLDLLSSLHIGLFRNQAGLQIDSEEMRRTIHKVVIDERNQGTFKARLAEAKDFFRAGLKSQAAKVFESLLKENPDDAVAASGLLQAQATKNAAALEQINRLIANDPANYSYWFEMLNYFMANNLVGRFTQTFDKIIAEIRSANESFWLFQLASMCLTLKLPQFAKRCLKLLDEHRTEQNAWMPYYVRSRFYLERGNLERATQEIIAAKQNCKFQSAEIHNIEGIIARRQKRHEEALLAFRNAAKAAPGDYRIRYNLALSYLETGNNDRGIAALRRAIEIFPAYERAAMKLQEIAPVK